MQKPDARGISGLKIWAGPGTQRLSSWPLPSSLTVCGELLALSSMRSSPSREPLPDASNSTVILHELPAARAAPQVFEMIEKSPLPEIASAAMVAVARLDDGLLSVTVLDAPLCPVPQVPKSSWVGETLSGPTWGAGVGVTVGLGVVVEVG